MPSDPQHTAWSFLELARQASDGRLPPQDEDDKLELLVGWAINHHDELPAPTEPETGEITVEEQSSCVAEQELRAAIHGDYEPARNLFLLIEQYDQEIERFHSRLEFDTTFFDDEPERAAEYQERTDFLEELRRPRGYGLTIEHFLHNLVPPTADEEEVVVVTDEMEQLGLGLPGQTFEDLGERALQNAAVGQYDLLENVWNFLAYINRDIRSMLISDVWDEHSIHRDADERQRYYDLLRMRAPFLRTNAEGETLLDRLEAAHERLEAQDVQEEEEDEDDTADIVYTNAEIETVAASSPRATINACKNATSPDERNNRIAEQLRSNQCPMCRRKKLHDPCFLPCGHVFCVACAVQWTFNRLSCPTCLVAGDPFTVANWIKMIDVIGCEHEPPCITRRAEESEDDGHH